MEFGIFSFGELTPDPSNGIQVSAQERIRQLIDLAGRTQELLPFVFPLHRREHARTTNGTTFTTGL